MEATSPHPNGTKELGSRGFISKLWAPPGFSKTNTLMMHSQTNFFVASADRQGEGGGWGLREGEQGQGTDCSKAPAWVPGPGDGIIVYFFNFPR